MSKPTKKSENSNGIALILVILALSIMLLMALTVATTSTTSVLISSASGQETTAHYLAEAGLNQVLAMVRSINNGDLNDLLAGPDAQCASPCTANGSSWATFATHPLSTHGNEFVIDNSSTGTGNNSAGTAGKWARVTNTQLLAHSLQPGPLFSPGTQGFQAGDTSAIATGGDGPPSSFLPSSSGSWVAPSSANLQWGGKLSFTDPKSNLKYVTLVELYDDDDPLGLQYNAWNMNGVVYPGGFSVSLPSSPSSKLFGPYPPANDPNAAAQDSQCGLSGNSPFECPGTNVGRSFGGVNQEFNNRILLRATGRILKQYDSGSGGLQWHVLSESIIDAVIGFLPYPAVLTDGCLNMQGNASITGVYGSVFTNNNLCVTGSGVQVSQVSGSAGDICGTTKAQSEIAGQPPIFIPDFKPIPDGTAATLDDGPQAAPYANPKLDLTTPVGFIPLPFSQSAAGDRVYPGDFWLRQIAPVSTISPPNAGLNVSGGPQAGGYVFVAARNTSGSRRTCVRGGTCVSVEDGILARMGITEVDLDALKLRVAMAQNGPAPNGNADNGFDPNHALIIRLATKKANMPINGGTGTKQVDVIDRNLIFITSLSPGNSSTESLIDSVNSGTAGGPKGRAKKTGGTAPTSEFYRIIPGVVASNGGNVTTASTAAGLGLTLSSYNAGSPSNKSSNQSVADTAHGFSYLGGSSSGCTFPGGYGTGSPNSACTSCGNCPSQNTMCTNPYGADWTIADTSLDTTVTGYSYFIDGNFVLGGTGLSAPAAITLIITGHFDIQGNGAFTPVMKANLSPLQPPFTSPIIQFLIGTDMKTNGTPSNPVQFDGLAYAREQIDLSGNGSYNGQIIAGDKANYDNDVAFDTIAGNFTVTFNRSINVLGTLSVTSWRKLKF
jgi:hypothetical protein